MDKLLLLYTAQATLWVAYLSLLTLFMIEFLPFVLRRRTYTDELTRVVLRRSSFLAPLSLAHIDLDHSSRSPVPFAGGIVNRQEPCWFAVYI